MIIHIINVGFIFMVLALLYIALGVIIFRTFPGLFKGVKKKHMETLKTICRIIGATLVLSGVFKLLRIIGI